MGQRLLDKKHGISYVGGDLVPVAHQLLKKGLGVQPWLVVEVFKEHVLDLANRFQPLQKALFIKELTDLDAMLCVLIGIKGGDTRFGRAEGVAPQPLLFILVLEDMVRHQYLGAL